MVIKGKNISMTRGDSESLTVRCAQDGVPVPLRNGDSIYFTVREDAESGIALQKIVTDFDENGEAVIRIEPADTAGLDFGSYVYDLQLTRADGTVTTLVNPARFTLTEEVTY